ncbi:uncharacterized protein LOC134276235 isoform X2 [Saccostrea cucullata]
MLNVSINVTCEFSGARAKIRGGNEITHCENRKCVNGGQFSGKDNLLNVVFPMDYKSHIDNVLEVSVTCSNGSVFEYELYMVPCISEFQHTVECNRTHAQIMCEHNSYNLSKHGMTIKNLTTGNILGTCWRQQKSQKCLPNGAQLILPYVYGQEIQCEMDGQFININITCNQVSEFQHTVECNRTHAQITCEHNSYNLSKHGMTIKNLTTGNMLVTCKRQEKSQKCLPNGAQLILPYVYGQEIQCEMDGKFVNINITCKQANRTDDQTSGQLGHSYKVLTFGCFLLPLLTLLFPQYDC